MVDPRWERTRKRLDPRSDLKLPQPCDRLLLSRSPLQYFVELYLVTGRTADLRFRQSLKNSSGRDDLRLFDERTQAGIFAEDRGVSSRAKRYRECDNRGCSLHEAHRSNETELSQRWGRRALLDSQLSSLNPQLSQYNGQRLAPAIG